ncbi:DUF1073 domain-containing protein (plasmid) [Borrelia miyamotoi]|uniref:DUF1073 domain-containing protein n=1 Tax=Borrelia miyamotoi TaxID=47466 RepID=A0AAQ3HF19_9SPIR|nr:anti-CBASS Acb1 family protein [Borrelia miyamotoi]ATQ15343.1 DUF1073 domain-containing protein [Borrelia miyamotoi]ATQ17673.1 DUF1073 domain-containing protein [Borrelia miyamotoi]ATQ18875.1 DUF1073 domain-containing protein [Borrelia miyamotoi]QBK62487.1 DUF1073 domain-containing protein [Borrelia miyamotoi]QBK63766.1 DUF1073 domain-containing protein [Borrelia miyamotoi]
MSLKFKISARELYQYSIFFRNYIENVAEDVLKNGITLKSTSSSVKSMGKELDNLKLELKEVFYLVYSLIGLILVYSFVILLLRVHFLVSSLIFSLR